MRGLMMVSDFDQEDIHAVLMDVGCEMVTAIRIPDDIGAECGTYDVAIVQVYDGNGVSVPETLDENAPGLALIRTIAAKYPECAILAITHSKISDDGTKAFEAGAHWFQSINWMVNIDLQFLVGQIEHARAAQQRKMAAA